MNFSHRPWKELITGTSGSGKTTLYLQRLSASKARWKFIFDHEGELAAKLRCRPAFTREEMNAQTATGCCLYDPSGMFPGRLPEAFNFFCDYTFTISTRLKGQKLFCSDELQKLIGTDVCPHELAMILDTGRRHELDLVCISQSPNLIHTRIRNQLTRITTFRQVDARAIDFLQQNGFDADQVRGLLPGQYLTGDLTTGELGRGEVFKAKGVNTNDSNRDGPGDQRATEPVRAASGRSTSPEHSSAGQGNGGPRQPRPKRDNSSHRVGSKSGDATDGHSSGR